MYLYFVRFSGTPIEEENSGETSRQYDKYVPSFITQIRKTQEFFFHLVAILRNIVDRTPCIFLSVLNCRAFFFFFFFKKKSFVLTHSLVRVNFFFAWDSVNTGALKICICPQEGVFVVLLRVLPFLHIPKPHTESLVFQNSSSESSPLILASIQFHIFSFPTLSHVSTAAFIMAK